MENNNDINLLKKELELKNKEIESLKNRLDFLENQIINKNRKIFGKSSEKVDQNQLSFFNEAEQNSNSKINEPTVEEITYKRNKPSKNSTMKDNLSNLEVVEVEHKLDSSEKKCDICNEEMQVIGSKTKDILVYEPVKMYIERHITYTYACKKCEIESGEANIITTEAPKNLITKSIASNNLLAYILSQKYELAIPLYRQEKHLQGLGVCLSRQTLSNWTIACAEKLDFVYDKLREKLLLSNYIQADETTLKVVDTQGKESRSKTYMWLYKNQSCDNQIILFDYQKTRSSSCPKKFLEGFSGYLQTDGYNGYNKVDNATRIYCLAHIRRKFFEVIQPILNNKEALERSRASIGFNYCEQIYELEKYIKENYKSNKDFYDKRHKIRLKKLKPILDEFNHFVNEEVENALPKSSLGKALEYAKDLIPNMYFILEDGHLEIDNNAAERAIKPFVIGRKNWLFCKNQKGAHASATIYSIIETAKANNLIAERYLAYLFDKMTGIDDFSKFNFEPLMPWADEIPKYIKKK